MWVNKLVERKELHPNDFIDKHFIDKLLLYALLPSVVESLTMRATALFLNKYPYSVS
jgi:hypothetical protein